MSVQYRLPRHLPTVRSNVKSLRIELLSKHVLDQSQESKGIGVFLVCHLPQRHHVPFWDHKGMAFRDWEAV
jgi:hypothetical protein